MTHSPGDRWLIRWGWLMRLIGWVLTVAVCVAAWSCWGCAFAEACRV